jgi:cell division protein FtsQ
MKRKIKILAHIFAWILLVAGLAATFAFSYSEISAVECREIQLNFDEEQTIKLSRQEIIRLVNAADNKIIGKRLKDINSEIIEQEVNTHNAILRADAYKTVVRDTTGLKGILAVKVVHRTPVMRVMTQDANYFMDAEGARFPTSTRYSANVIIVTGNVSENLARNSLLPLIMYISEDEFWKAQIKQVHIDRNEEILLTPLVGNQLIEFGTAENYRAKLRNLMAFYEQVITSNNWDKYERISLKYRNQIIAKKRD